MEYNFGTQLDHGEDKENKKCRKYKSENMNVNKEMGIKKIKKIELKLQ